VDDTHIMGPLNEITRIFDHLLTQLTLVGFRVKMSKCKFWSPSGISLGIEDSSSLHLGHRWLTHFGCANGFLRLYFTFFRWGFISRHDIYQWFSFRGRCPNCFGHFVLIDFLISHKQYLFFLLVSFGEFRQESYACIWDIMGLRLWECFQGPLARR
jgi:hypothetical protein